jgi:hypothetical protein
MPISLKSQYGGSSTPIGGIVELNPAFPPTIELEGQKFVKNGYAVLDGYDPVLEPYKSVVTSFETGTGIGVAGIKAATQDGNVLIAVGTGNLIARSVDSGATWTKITSPITCDFEGIASFDGVTIAVGSNASQIIRSTDKGLTWTAITVASGCTGIATNGTSWVICRSATSNQIYRSVNKGLTWIAVTSTVIGTNQLGSIAYSEGTYAVTRLTTHTSVWISNSDALQWVAISSIPAVESVIAKGKLFFFSGGSSTNNWCTVDNFKTITTLSSYNFAIGEGKVCISGDMLYWGGGTGGTLYRTKLTNVVNNFSGDVTSFEPQPQVIQTVASAGEQVLVFYDSTVDIRRSVNGVGLEIENQKASNDFSTDRFYMRYY